MRTVEDPSDFGAWVGRAEEDFLGAEMLAQFRPRVTANITCFHAQQCAEKYLKAFLVFHHVTFPKVHDLDALLELAVKIDPGLDPLRPLLRLLTPFAVELRYPGDPATEEEAREALAHARQVRAAFRKRLGLEP